jgi:hypothetical protein
MLSEILLLHFLRDVLQVAPKAASQSRCIRRKGSSLMSTKLGKLLGTLCLSLALGAAVSIGGCSSSTTNPKDAGGDAKGGSGGTKADGGGGTGGTTDGGAGTGGTGGTGGTAGSDASTDHPTDTATDTPVDTATTDTGADTADGGSDADDAG